MNNALLEHRKIRDRIRRYERKLHEEKHEHGFYRDSYGKRYLLGPSYLLIGDNEGALESFRWYEDEFPDDSGEPGHFLCWTLALYRSGDKEAAAKKLKVTMLSNLYIIPRLLGLDIVECDIWHASNEDEPSYLDYIPDEFFLLWHDEEKDWASDMYAGKEFVSVFERYVEIYRLLKDTPAGEQRSRLVDEAFKLRE